MIIPTRCYLNGNDTWKQFELVMSSKNIAPAEAKQNFQSIPARNGDLDLSEALMGIPFYGNREITITLGGKKARAEWTRTLSNVQNKYHNRKVQIIFEDDPSYYWEGRLTVNDDFELGNEVGTFSVTVNAQPYKMEMRDGGEGTCQAWDTFVFATDIFRNYHGLQVSGTITVNVYGNQMPVIPEFEVSAAQNLTVEYQGKTYQLQNGMNKFYDIVTGPGDNLFTFSGTGVVTIHYRGGSL